MSSMHGEGRHRHNDPTHRKGAEAASHGIHIKDSHKGLLHEHMHVKEGHKIPVSSIRKDEAKAKARGDTAEVKRDVFAINAKTKFHHG